MLKDSVKNLYMWWERHRSGCPNYTKSIMSYLEIRKSKHKLYYKNEDCTLCDHD